MRKVREEDLEYAREIVQKLSPFQDIIPVSLDVIQNMILKDKISVKSVNEKIHGVIFYFKKHSTYMILTRKNCLINNKDMALGSRFLKRFEEMTKSEAREKFLVFLFKNWEVVSSREDVKKYFK